MSAPANRPPLSSEAAYAAASVALPASTFASKHSPSATLSFRETIEAAKARDRHFNNLPSGMETDDPSAYRAEEERLWAASGAAVHSVPATWGEFIDLLDYMSTGGTESVEETLAARLLGHARRLNSAEPNALPAEWRALVAEFRDLAEIEKRDQAVFDTAEKLYLSLRTPEPPRATNAHLITDEMTLAQIKALPAPPENPEWIAWTLARESSDDDIMKPATQRWNASLRAADGAMTRVQHFPAPTFAMVTAKLALLNEHYGEGGVDTDVLAGILADLTRLHSTEVSA